MKKIFLLILIVLGCSSCSFLPRLTFDRPNTLPQSTTKTYRYERCGGLSTRSLTGEIISCSKNYYLNAQNYEQQERATTFKEKILNFLAALKGWLFFGAISGFFLVPGLFGTIIGWVTQNIFGASARGLKSTVEAISNAKIKIREINEPKMQEALNIILKELSDAHSEDKDVQLLINKIRGEYNAS